MRLPLQIGIANFIKEFAERYHEYKIKVDKLHAVRYRILTDLETFKKKYKLVLAFSDRPGDMLPPLRLDEIKNTPDIIAGLHPVDVNSINDLYYMSRDNIERINVEGDVIVATDINGNIQHYDINKKLDLKSIKSTRLSYMVGYMQGEKLMKDAYQEDIQCKVISDNIATLYVKDRKGKIYPEKPLEILFSGKYKKFSKEDVARIAYICGQMSQVKNAIN